MASIINYFNGWDFTTTPARINTQNANKFSHNKKSRNMNACPFLRLIVESLSLKHPSPPGIADGEVIHPSTTPYSSTVEVYPSSSTCPHQTISIPLLSDSGTVSSSRLCFHIDPSTIKKATPTSTAATVLTLLISIHVRRKSRTFNVCSEKRLVGTVKLTVDLNWVENRVYRTGWAPVIGKERGVKVHMVVRSEPDPRYVFQFDGEPECSPVIYQIGGCGGVRQPMFSCRFSSNRRSIASNRSLSSETIGNRRTTGGICCYYFSLGSRRNQRLRRSEQRKGWTVTIHDLSGFPVAAASIITPFVPSPGIDYVSRSNPGAWLILRTTTGVPSNNGWTPWGRLEAWREKTTTGTDALGYKFEVVVEETCAAAGIPVAESKLCVKKGGEFRIDVRTEAVESKGGLAVTSFVMGSTVEGEDKMSRPTVQIGAQHVRNTADSAVFIALSAAVDLSMDACRLFSKKLRKELCHDKRKHV